jgi:hypothetical protein
MLPRNAPGFATSDQWVTGKFPTNENRDFLVVNRLGFVENRSGSTHEQAFRAGLKRTHRIENAKRVHQLTRSDVRAESVQFDSVAKVFLYY